MHIGSRQAGQIFDIKASHVKQIFKKTRSNLASDNFQSTKCYVTKNKLASSVAKFWETIFIASKKDMIMKSIGGQPAGVIPPLDLTGS